MIRRTRQRAAIDAALEAAGRPLSPQELRAVAAEQLPGLGLRTVYRQIREMVAAGTLVGVDYPGQPLRYERVTGRHRAHLICRQCNQIFSYDHPVPDVPVDAPTWFDVKGQETIFFGVCEQCGKSGK